MCNRHGLTVTIDCLYSGTIVPLRYLGVETWHMVNRDASQTMLSEMSGQNTRRKRIV